MITKTFGSAVYGVDAHLVSIEVNIIDGTKLMMVGLPDNAVRESQHRMESVLKTLGYRMPRRRVIVNLAPASVRKEGTSYDLPIALCVLHASGQATLPGLDTYMIMGELALDGTLRPIRGALPIAIAARKRGFKGFLLPKENAREAAIVDKLAVFPIDHIQEAIAFLAGKQEIAPMVVDTRKVFARKPHVHAVNMADVQGQAYAKRAMEVAAAGGHNVLLVGPPGAGKTMLAKRVTTVLPPLTLQESLETTKIYSVVGKVGGLDYLITSRPFRAPHHTVSDVALVGGGTLPQPGEISLAHNGVLFLDELPEFKRSALEVLRQPLEDKWVTITRAKISVDFPANFMLVASMNPCPCGYYTHPDKACTCSPVLRQRYLAKISGPLMDRVDLHIEVTPVAVEELTEKRKEEDSAVIARRVLQAREQQRSRLVRYRGIHCNAMMPVQLVRQVCVLNANCRELIKGAIEKLGLSARAYDRILKVTRTIADLEGSDVIRRVHLAEAIHYRSLDRANWTG